MDASTFPVPFSYHLVFCIVAVIFFVIQFIRLKRPYQLVLAAAIAASLLIYVGDPHNRTWFHIVGVIEVVLLLGAIVLSIIGRIRGRKAGTPAEKETETMA